MSEASQNQQSQSPEVAIRAGQVLLANIGFLGHGAAVISQEEFIESRNKWLEATLNDDPDRPLPKVSLKEQPIRETKVIAIEGEPIPRPNQDVHLTSYAIMDDTDEKVGFVELVSPVGSSSIQAPKSYINNITTFRDRESGEAGKGYGPAAYLELLKLLPAGQGLRTRGRLREGSLRMWRRFADRGIARPIKQAAPYESDEAFETIF
ncbi:MAG TPA: hypothetical protein VH234_04605 [Candidatus Saccharimonadales bacterium]|jgi:hypothetical protein|nr:hypothetical protein [Candidatus Saccharimonadales bacterium]